VLSAIFGAFLPNAVPIKSIKIISTKTALLWWQNVLKFDPRRKKLAADAK